MILMKIIFIYLGLKFVENNKIIHKIDLNNNGYEIKEKYNVKTKIIII